MPENRQEGIAISPPDEHPDEKSDLADRPGPPVRQAPHRARRRLVSVALGLVAASCLLIATTDARIPLLHHDSVTTTAATSSSAVPPAPSGPPPTCQAPKLNVSDVLPNTPLEVSPLPDSVDASPETQVSLLGAAARDISDVTVRGARTGLHSGRLEAYSQGDGASFVPDHPFAEEEEVVVRGDVIVDGRRVPFAYRFTTAEEDSLSPPPAPTAPPTSFSGQQGVQHFVSEPDLEPPAVTVTVNEPGTEPGDVFTAPYTGPGQDGPMIFDDTGQLVWFQAMPANIEATNLQTGTYEGKPVITWWQGYIPPQGFGEGVEEIATTDYRTAKVVHAGNGLTVDLHEFHLLPDDEAIFTVFNPIKCDLRSVSGRQDGAVTDSIFQLIDLKTGLVRREWHALDHVPLSNASSGVSPTGSTDNWPFDYFHMNSIAFDSLDNLVISSRNTSAYYVLNSATLEVTAEVGGRDSTVSMGSGTQTNFQHDVVVLPGGGITLFDNGSSPQVESQSRAVVENLNLAANSVSEVNEYTYTGQALVSDSQGNFQTLANGDAFVGWGQVRYVTEFSPSGSTLFDADFPLKTESYRAYRFDWSAQPATPPSIGTRTTGGRLTVYASWNGATMVSAWRVLAGSDAHHLTPVTTATRSGFETAIPLTTSGPYVAVQALGSDGDVLGTSATVKG